MSKSLSKLFYPTVEDRIGRVEYMKLTILYNFLLPIVWCLALFLISLFIGVPIVLLSVKIFNISDEIIGLIVKCVYILNMGILLITCVINAILIHVKRLHDLNLSGFWMLIFLVPSSVPIIIPIPEFLIIINSLTTFIVFTMIRGTKGKNEYGTNDYVVKKTDYIYVAFYCLIYIICFVAHTFLIKSGMFDLTSDLTSNLMNLYR